MSSEQSVQSVAAPVSPSAESAKGYCFHCKVKLDKGGSDFVVSEKKLAHNGKNPILIGKCKKCDTKMSVIAKVDSPVKKQ
jgi:hypothetical protein